MTLTADPKHPGINKARAPGEQDEAYLVLSQEERDKGFVRPVRGSYLHLGRHVCGKPRNSGERDRTGRQWVCTGSVGHEGECYTWKAVDDKAAETAAKTHQLGGCGTVTTMAAALAETYARDPKFYGATWCCVCNAHFPVSEFHWLDGTTVGS